MITPIYAGSKNLNILNIIRLVVLLTEAALLAGAQWYFDIKPVWPPVLAIFVATATLIIFTSLRYRKRSIVSSGTLFPSSDR